jgi:hypothetical protein
MISMSPSVLMLYPIITYEEFIQKYPPICLNLYSLSCKGIFFGLDQYHNDQQFTAWSILQSNLIICDAEAKLPDFDMTFIISRLACRKHDSKLWNNEINNQMA